MPDEAAAEELRAELDQMQAPGRSWWPFGAKKRRVIWRSV